MPKLIDNYVLNRKIGAGQYGEVYRGYDRATNNEIAVKAIQRDKVKGTSIIMQASSVSCSKAKSKCLRAAKTQTSSDFMIWRRLQTTSI